MIYKYRTKGSSQPNGKHRVYFTCHPHDFKYFDQICEDIFATCDCAVYYTEDMAAAYDGDRDIDMGEINLFIVPVTFTFLSRSSRALDDDVPYAFEHHIPVLPIVLESGLDDLYQMKIGNIEYLSKVDVDSTMISYEDKLKKFLSAVLISNEMTSKVRAAFDAYIFMSYRKKDRRYANELMRIIHNNPECRNIAIWYDEFLIPGENFEDSIHEMLEKSDIFTMAVTPSIIEEGNYVQAVEYPSAIRNGKDIVPVEMAPTDKEKLKSLFKDINISISSSEDDKISDVISGILADKGKKLKSGDPEHNFLIGLAYLDGIDVEKNTGIALEMITNAADSGVLEAMLKLVDMYSKGVGSERNLDKAFVWYEKAHGRAVEIFDEDDLRLLEIKEDFAVFLCDEKSDMKRGIEFSEYVYMKRSRLQGAEHEDTLGSMTNLTYQYYLNGEFKKSLGLAERLHEIFLRKYGEENKATLSVKNTMALDYKELSMLDKSVELGEEILNASRAIYGEASIETLGAMETLSSCMDNKSDYDGGKVLLEEAYRLSEKLLGEDHPKTVYLLGKMENYFYQTGDSTRCIPLLEDVYKKLTAIYGREHFNTIDSLMRLAVCYLNNLMTDKAIECCEEGYALGTKTLGLEHIATLRFANILADSHLQKKNYDESLKYITIAYEGYKKINGEKGKDTLNAEFTMAGIYIKSGRPKEGLEIAQALRQKYIELYGGEDIVSVKSTELAMADAYEKCGDLEKAFGLFRKGYEFFLSMFGEESRYVTSLKRHVDKLEVLLEKRTN